MKVQEIKEIVGIALMALVLMITLNFGLVLLDKKLHFWVGKDNSNYKTNSSLLSHIYLPLE